MNNNAVKLENSNVTLMNVHSERECAGRSCPIHNRSNHHMRSFPQNFRSDKGFMERVCSHGVGHPDPDDLFAPKLHGCDGCCVDNSKNSVNNFSSLNSNLSVFEEKLNNKTKSLINKIEAFKNKVKTEVDPSATAKEINAASEEFDRAILDFERSRTELKEWMTKDEKN